MIVLGLDISFCAFKVWYRDMYVYKRTWLINFLTPILEPVLYVVAFGFGLGAMISMLVYEGYKINYLTFVAPAIISITALNYSFFETTYGSFVRMYYQKTFDGIISTPLSAEDVILGEILWGATKSVISGSLMLIVIASLKLVVFPSALFIIPVCLLSGLVFGGLGMVFTSVTPRIDMFNIPVFVIFLPMYFFSGTFFPLTNLPNWAQMIAQVFPLTHLTLLIRNFGMGIFNLQMIYSFIYLFILCLVFIYLSIVMMKRRLIK